MKCCRVGRGIESSLKEIDEGERCAKDFDID